ncbi:MAG: lytic transglycosylase domain-containing protein [Thermoleophilaceae bacterium]|nr:lytic transglycosylase domain-containing protein [Thermoleophilaceae bacterium]
MTYGSARAVRRRAARRSPARSRAIARRRRLAAAALLVAVVGAAVALAVRLGPDAVRELYLPLRHEDVIRQQARDKGLDPALIAAVIYQESKFRDRTSAAGAKGLMQILPDTARFIARKSGGTRFELRDLGTPQINIAYGSWYLRYLMQRYAGDEKLAVAAYNAGERNVDRWVEAAGGPERFDAERDIPFPETRAYVAGVLAKEEEYRRSYAHELGLD